MKADEPRDKDGKLTTGGTSGRGMDKGSHQHQMLKTNHAKMEHSNPPMMKGTAAEKSMPGKIPPGDTQRNFHHARANTPSTTSRKSDNRPPEGKGNFGLRK